MNLRLLFDSFQKLHVLIIGDVIVDNYIRGQVDRISPEAPVPIIHVKERYFSPGGAGNVALNIHSLGASASLCSILGNDTHGRDLIEQFTKYKINTSGIVLSPHRQTTIKTRVMAEHQHLLRVDEEVDHEISSDEEDQLIKHIERILPSCDVVIFQDYDKGIITPRLITQVISLGKLHRVPIAVDPKKRNFMHYKNCSLFKPNLKELQSGLNEDLSAADPSQVMAAAARLADRIQAERIMVTLSEKGLLIYSQKESVHTPAHAYEVADVSGAGDSVISVAALGLALNLPLTWISKLSNIAGGLACQHLGVVAVQRDDLLAKAESELS